MPRKNNLPGPGPGRPKGVPNKVTGLLKDAILKAATLAGGPAKPETEYPGGLVGFLLLQALKAENGPFMTLLGKVLPMQLTGEDGPLIDLRNRMNQHLGTLSDDELAALESAATAFAASEDDAGGDPGGEDPEAGGSLEGGEE